MRNGSPFRLVQCCYRIHADLLSPQAFLTMSATSLDGRVRLARRNARISQSTLAGRVGVSRSAVAQWELSKGTSPTSANLARIAACTRVSFEWLATGRGTMRPHEREDHALVLDAFAHDALEERALIAIRCLKRQQAEAIVVMLEALAR